MTHDCTYTQAVLTGDAPQPRDRGAFDAGMVACKDCKALFDALNDIQCLAETLPPLAVPPALSQKTLAAVRAEMRPKRRWAPVLSLVVAAAAAWAVWVDTPPAPAPAERLVARGSDLAPPHIALKVAVDEGNGLQRHRRDTAYAPGTAVRFRVDLDRPANVVLLRVDTAGAAVVVSHPLPEGEHDIQLGSAPLSWNIEANDADAQFVVLAAPPDAALDDSLSRVQPFSGADEEASVCAVFAHLGCDERLLRVKR